MTDKTNPPAVDIAELKRLRARVNDPGCDNEISDCGHYGERGSRTLTYGDGDEAITCYGNAAHLTDSKALGDYLVALMDAAPSIFAAAERAPEWEADKPKMLEYAIIVKAQIVAYEARVRELEEALREIDVTMADDYCTDAALEKIQKLTTAALSSAPAAPAAQAMPEAVRDLNVAAHEALSEFERLQGIASEEDYHLIEEVMDRLCAATQSVAFHYALSQPEATEAVKP